MFSAQLLLRPSHLPHPSGIAAQCGEDASVPRPGPLPLHLRTLFLGERTLFFSDSASISHHPQHHGRKTEGCRVLSKIAARQGLQFHSPRQAGRTTQVTHYIAGGYTEASLFTCHLSSEPLLHRPVECVTNTSHQGCSQFTRIKPLPNISAQEVPCGACAPSPAVAWQCQVEEMHSRPPLLPCHPLTRKKSSVRSVLTHWSVKCELCPSVQP